MTLSLIDAKTLASNYYSMNPIEIAIKMIDQKILETVINIPNITIITLSSINFPIPPNCSNWKSLVSTYNKAGWDILRNSEKITLIWK